MTASENRTIFTIEPERWMVAHSGITKFRTGSETLFFLAASIVTGMVAALEAVPNAVTYAERMFHSDFNGRRPATAPAIRY